MYVYMYMCTTSFVSHAAAEDDGPPVRRREEKRRRVSYNVLVENQSKSIYCREGKDAIDSEETRACIVRVMAAAAACRAGWGADMTRRGREEREGIRLLAGPWRARTILRRRYIIESFLCRARLFKLYTYVRIHVYTYIYIYMKTSHTRVIRPREAAIRVSTNTVVVSKCKK